MPNTSIHYPNTLFLSTIPSTLARLEYNAPYKLVKKARAVSEKLAKEMTEAGFNVPNVGDPCPYIGLLKNSAYTVRVGAKLSYKKLTERKAERLSGQKIDFEVKKKKMGYFPIFNELIYVKDDFSKAYIRCFPHIDADTMEQAQKMANYMPKPKYIFKGDEISRLAFAPWATADDFARWNGDEVENTNVISVTNADGTTEFLKPLDADGNEMQGFVCTKQVRTILVENCKLIVNGSDIVPQMFDSLATYNTETLEKIRDEFLARCSE